MFAQARYFVLERYYRLWNNMDLKSLWADASMEEQIKLLLTMLDAVYVDAKKTKSIVAIRPKPLFKPILQVAATKEDLTSVS
jgi:site-specific DNA recombinase